MKNAHNQEIAEVLQQSRLFKHLEPDTVKVLVPLLNGRVRAYKSGEMIFQEGDRVERIGIILEGTVCLAKLHDDGSENLMEKLGTPMMVGTEIACTKSKLSPYMMYCESDCQIYSFSYGEIEKPGIIDEILRLTIKQDLLEFIANENIRKLYKIDVLSDNGIRQRIMTYLRGQAMLQGAASFEIPFNREQLANYLCVNRSALSHELSVMRKEGLIHCWKNKFEIL